MSVELKSGATADLATVTPVGKSLRVTIYDALGNDLSEHLESFIGACSSFRTLGNAAAPQNLLTIENLTGSGKIIYLQSIEIAMDTTVALLTVSCQFDLSRTTAIPSGGTALTKTAMDTTLSSSGNVIVRGATASDGGAASAITATAATGYIARQFLNRQATAVGQVVPNNPIEMLPQNVTENDTLILRENQAVVLQVTGTAASNAATNHYLINVFWHEA